MKGADTQDDHCSKNGADGSGGKRKEQAVADGMESLGTFREEINVVLKREVSRLKTIASELDEGCCNDGEVGDADGNDDHGNDEDPCGNCSAS